MYKHLNELTIVNDSSCVCSFDFLISVAADDRRECGAASPSAAKRRTEPSILNADVFIVDSYSILLSNRKQ